MRLTSIKLSGFKSFVDPTVIRINGQRIGVVGPNGCGKSNIIDAVRWVLGESRASELRGESMKDVIFNGTTQRKPAGRASVELVFDNSDGRVAGQWGQYNELAVKRILTREGGSTYYINNLPVRRRDVQDIFLGTGLGPRAYAIIGQGMIARIIEARPDELRVFLEEAAGVSKYRERRRETENRLSDTRENLNRVTDILHELDQNLEKLRLQADLAMQYHNLVSAKKRQQEWLWLMQKQAGVREQAELAQEIAQAQTKLEAMTTELFKREAELEKIREAHDMANRDLHVAQGALYQTNAEIGSIEAQIRYVQETKKRLQTQLRSYHNQKDQWARQIASFSDELAVVKERLSEASLHEEAAREYLLSREQELPQAEEAVSAVREQAHDIHEHIVQIRQQIAVSSAGHKNLYDAIQDCKVRREKLLQQQNQAVQPDMDELNVWREELAELEWRLEEMRENMESSKSRIPELEKQYRLRHEQLNACHAQCMHGQARLDALKQLQEKTQSGGKWHDWLEKQGLAGFSPLWQSVHIETGWETALEVALAERMRALEISSLDRTLPFADGVFPAKICFFSVSQGCHTGKTEENQCTLPRLSDMLQCDKPSVLQILRYWLSHVYAANSLEEALRNREMLSDGACIVVPAGHVTDRYSIRFFAAESELDGVFARQQEIMRLEQKQREQDAALLDAERQCRHVEADIEEVKTQVGVWQEQAVSFNERIHESRLAILKREEAARLYHEQSERIEADLSELLELMRDREMSLLEEEKKLEELDSHLAQWQEQEVMFHDKVSAGEENLRRLQETIRQAERKVQQSGFEHESLLNRMAELKRQIEAAESQIQRIAGELGQGQLELQELDDSGAHDDLQELLDTRLAQEASLAEARSQLDELAQTLRNLLEQRLRLERSLQPQRDKIVALQLKEQAARLNIEQYDQKLSEAGADIVELARTLPPQATIQAMQAEIGRLSVEIEKLGAVNLGAAMELEEGEKRRRYLQEQYQDLNDAIVTLEDAIRRIDRETRMLLKNTFDQVNQSFKSLFAMLFGGGNAQLLMTGNEILDAGVQIMAQPPGKKNTTIHLLSGGEKALTAIALVFSLFQLNPAPFCLLDEVDAPLDDANTERFGNMVNTMSQQTQFLFISHNRIAMEMAEELVGVTMQEQGVSRIVTVDIQDAAKFSNEVLRA